MGRRKTHEEYVAQVAEINPNIEVIGQYVNANVKILHRCKIDDQEWMATPDHILHGTSCPYCSGIKPIIGETDLWSTRPDIASMLQDKNEGYALMEFSNKKTNFVCPICGDIIYAAVYHVSTHGLYCNHCSDGISYPEKFMRCFLNRLCVDYTSQYSPEWIKPYSYDFYFKINEKEYIVEMDGGLGHGFQSNTSFAISKEESVTIDNYKDAQADNHNITMIRINCNYRTVLQRKEYIEKNIKQSILSKLFDINNIDFDMCHKQAESSIVLQVSDIWNSGIQIVKDIAKLLHLSTTCVINDLRIGEQIGISTYNHIEYCNKINKIKAKIIGIKNSKPVRCIETNEIFVSASEASFKYNGSVYDFFYGRNKYAGTLDDGTKLHWEYLSADEEFAFKERKITELYI